MTIISMPPALTETIEAGRAWLWTVVNKGAHCPLCGQYAKVYRRRINAGMAKSMIRMYRLVGNGWVHVSVLGAESREEGKLAYWDLVEEQQGRGAHGGRAGYWRLTDRGLAFVEGRLHVQTYALVYNGRCIAFDGPPTSIRDALGSKFDYQELMSR